MVGHSPVAVAEAVQHRFATLGGATAMLPTEDAEWVGAELTRRFGLTRWSFSLTATDANRWAIRLARAVTGRPKILGITAAADPRPVADAPALHPEVVYSVLTSGGLDLFAEVVSPTHRFLWGVG
ncbi:hypothetical protein ACIBAH_20960 [Streptomyces sp. NPDC051445]|uniref:hypothetical protein n=1 Tax=Streptomyces sp. NPDC051445 TaxID=3365653 RepID=UPI00378D73C5